MQNANFCEAGHTQKLKTLCRLLNDLSASAPGQGSLRRCQAANTPAHQQLWHINFTKDREAQLMVCIRSS